MTANPTVAVLGTGTMGAPMARNLAKAGLDVRAWNRTREKADPLADVATVTDTPAEAVKGADVVLTMLYDLDSVATTMEQARGQYAEGAIWLQQSTVGVAGTSRLVELAGDLGLTYVDAPVLGTKKPAEDGALVVLAAGPSQVKQTLAPVLDAVGGRTMWVSETPGDGTKLKLVANSWVLTVLEGIADSLTFARQLGLDPQLFLDAVGGGAMDAPYVQLKGKAMLTEQLDPAFALSGALKDADLVIEAADEAGVDLAMIGGIREHLARAVDAGHGDLDMAATYLAH